MNEPIQPPRLVSLSQNPDTILVEEKVYSEAQTDENVLDESSDITAPQDQSTLDDLFSVETLISGITLGIFLVISLGAILWAFFLVRTYFFS